MKIEEIKRVEATLGVQLPHDYLLAVKLKDTDYLDLYIRCLPNIFNLHSLPIQDAIEDSESIVLCGCNNLKKLVPLLEPHEEGWNIQLEGLDLLIVILQEGTRFWCLDYRTCGVQGEPSVLYVDAESQLVESIEIASKFRLAPSHIEMQQ